MGFTCVVDPIFYTIWFFVGVLGVVFLFPGYGGVCYLI